MRSLWPCSDSSRTPSFPSQLELKIGLPRANPRGSLKFLSFSRIPIQLEKNDVVPTSSQDEALARYSVSRGDRDLGVAFSMHRGSQSLSRGEAKDSALRSSHDEYRFEPIEWPKGSQASSGAWREKSGLFSRPCRKRRPSSCDDGGVSRVFSSCGTSVGFLTRYNWELREPLLWRQESKVSMRVARRSASLLSSHGRGIGAQDALKKDSRGLSQVVAGNPGFPQLVLVTSGSISGCL